MALVRAPPAPLPKGAVWAAPFFPAGYATNGLLSMSFPYGTRAPTAAFRSFRSDRFQATTREGRNDIGQHRAHE